MSENKRFTDLLVRRPLFLWLYKSVYKALYKAYPMAYPGLYSDLKSHSEIGCVYRGH